jgi:hypothetical protein
MRYRLRTLFIAITVLAVAAAAIGWILDAFRPGKIVASREGRLALRQLGDARQVRIKMHIDGAEKECDLSPDATKALLAWLKKAVRDTRPAKRILLGDFWLDDSRDAWLILQMNAVEVSVQTPHGTWRGPDRAELEKFIQDCPHATGLLQQP